MTNPLDLFNQLGAVQDAAEQNGIRPELLHAVMQTESGGRPDAVSPKGALGPMQLMPATAKDLGVDPRDPVANIHGGAQYLRQLLDRYDGDEQKALAAYNAGPGNVDKYGGVPPFKETRDYVAKVSGGAGPSQPNVLDVFNALGSQSEQKPAEEPGFLDNLKSSAGNFISGIGETIAHPIETAKNLGKVAAGAAESAVPALKESLGGDYTPYSRAMLDFYKQRYGGLENIKHTLYTDPVGAAADAAAVLTGGGEALGTIAKEGGTLSRIADAAKAAGSVVDPLRVPTNIAKATVQPAADVLSHRIIESNVKPNTALMKRNPGVDIPDVILREGFSKGKKGALQADALKQDLFNQVGQLADADAATGAKYSLQPLVDELKARRAEAMHNPAGADNVAAYDAAINELMNHPLYSREKLARVPVTLQAQVPTGTIDAAGNPITQSRSLTVQRLQPVGRELVPQDASEINRMKQNIYKDNSKSYGERKRATIEADKAQARELKGILDNNVEGAQPLNQRYGEVKVAGQALRDMALREGKKYPVGLMDLLGGNVGVGAAAAGHPVIGAAALASLLLKHPSTSWPLAKMLYRISNASVPAAAGAITPLQRVNESTAPAQGRPVTMDELRQRYADYLASQQ